MRRTLRSIAVVVAAVALPVGACAPASQMASGPGVLQGDRNAHAFLSAVDLREIETSMLAQDRASDPTVRMFAMSMLAEHSHALEARENRLTTFGHGLGIPTTAWVPVQSRWVTVTTAPGGLQPAAAPTGQTWVVSRIRYEAALTPAGMTTLRRAFDRFPAARMVADNTVSDVQLLSRLSGSAFDMAYMDAQVNIHRFAIENVDQLLDNRSVSAEMLGILRTTRASLAANLELAQQIRSRM